jgi:hypothetical protein
MGCGLGFGRRLRGLGMLALTLVLAGAVAAGAQTVTGTIQGTVTDSSGGVLPGTTVTITHVDTGASRTVVTNDAGFYSAPFIQIGRYSVRATLAGFGTILRTDVVVALNDTRVVDFKLEPRVTSEVTVTGGVPAINLTKAEVKSSLTDEQIMDKPSPAGNNFLDLASIFPGFQENPTSGQNNPTASSGSSINFNNTGTRGATFQINGVNNDDSSENQNRQSVALATIQEFQILKNTYSAEFGRGDGAVVLVQTKSGTNRLHGDLLAYRQDSDWNARTFFAAPGSAKADRVRNETSFSVGGPLLRNRLFAYGAADYAKIGGRNNYARDIPLPSEINGPWLTRGNDTPENRAWIQSFIDRFAGLTPNDPRSNRTYAGLQRVNWPDYDYSGRLDWNRKAGQTVTTRYQWTHQLRETEDIVIGENAVQDHAQQNFGLTWTHPITNALVGELRYGLGVRSTNVNILAGNDTPIVRFTGSPVSGSIVGNAGTFPINRDQTDHQFVYNVTAQLFSRHSLRAGTDIRRQKLDDLADSFSRGFWTFTTSCGGVTYATPYAAFFDGCVNRFERSYGPFFLENRMNEANFYVQDDWRLTEAITLNLGARYEYVSAPKEKEGRIDYVFGADKDNIEPRLGIAYAPRWESGFLRTLSGGPGNMAFHAGWGIYDGRIFQSVFSQGGASVRFNPPNALNRVLTNTLPNALSLADPSMGFVFTPGAPTSRISIAIPSEDLEMPATKKWNLSIERLMPWSSTLKIAYQGNHNDKRLRFTPSNLPQSPLDGPITVVDHPYNAPTGTFPDLRGKVINAIAADVRCAGTGFFGIATTTACPVPVPIADNEISVRVPRTNERRPNPLYGTNTLITNEAESWYKGVEVTWDKRFSHGAQFLAAYTWSRSEDTVSEATFVGAGDTNQPGNRIQYARGRSRFDTPHRLTLSGSYRLPIFKNRRDWLGQTLGGWTLSGVLRAISGTPFTVTVTGVDIDFDGFSEARPVILDRSILYRQINNPATSEQLLPREAFRAPTFEDHIEDLVPRNAFYGDGVQNVDLALAKNFYMPWSSDILSVRIEAFNAFNEKQFAFPVLDINSTTFGRINNVNGLYQPRVVQLRLWYRF